DRGKSLGAGLSVRLRAQLGDQPHLGEIRWRGEFQRIELGADRARKTPYDTAQTLHAKHKQSTMAAGQM
ncbi:aspartate aminotransferase family protein, partial [Pseudomonas syringae pv. tagetis]